MRWITYKLGILIALIIIWNILFSSFSLIKKNNDLESSHQEDTYQSEHTIMIIYNKKGILNYKLVADSINYFPKEQIIYFVKPAINIFNEFVILTWTIRADKAKLTKDNTLYLYGNVRTDNMSKTSYLKSFVTDKAVIRPNYKRIF